MKGQPRGSATHLAAAEQEGKFAHEGQIEEAARGPKEGAVVLVLGQPAHAKLGGDPRESRKSVGAVGAACHEIAARHVKAAREFGPLRDANHVEELPYGREDDKQRPAGE